MKHLFCALTALSLVFASTSFAQDVVVSYGDMVSVLSGRHGMPEGDYFARLKPDSARETLIKIAGDEKVFPVARARALLALTHFKTSETASIVADKAVNDKNAYIRSSAYEALGNMEGEKAVKTIGEGLKDTDVMVRLSAIRSLGRIGGQEAQKLMEDNLPLEKNPTASSVMKKSLEQIR
ncbi:MAG: HEAT repeat domain-containing protein [Nitrospinae bacterium]|nr:HEAT repeat domain-containing protein [Nitrospinota bacterium]MBF0633978.1 HEAT repeat domain-containing protein [Nitrospinota bacterium]